MSFAPPDDAIWPSAGDVIWLDANENPYTWPEHLLAQAWAAFRSQGPHRYPRNRRQLCRALGAYAGVPEEWVLPGNGSDELIIAMLSSLGRRVRRILLPWPTFGFYRHVGRALDLPLGFVELKGDFSLPLDDLLAGLGQGNEAMVVLCRPNNPTGNLFGRELVLAALEAGAWVVVDEAYYEFSGETVTDLLGQYGRLVVMRTLSKAFALAGLRVGYALAHPDTLALLRSVMQPYNVDAFSLAAALVALEHAHLARSWARAICAHRDRLARALQALGPVRPWPSRANFLLVEVLPEAGRPAADVVADLAEGGVRVRYWPDEPRLRDFFRVSVGLPRDNAMFVERLHRLLADHGGGDGVPRAEGR
ncbi:MAG: histidinol-phosphate transaminase [Bacillota bacterium]